MRRTKVCGQHVYAFMLRDVGPNSRRNTLTKNNTGSVNPLHYHFWTLSKDSRQNWNIARFPSGHPSLLEAWSSALAHFLQCHFIVPKLHSVVFWNIQGNIVETVSDTSPGFDTFCTGFSLVTPAKPPRLCRYSIRMHFQKQWKRQAFAPRLLILWWISGVLILLQASRYDHMPKARLTSGDFGPLVNFTADSQTDSCFH